MKISTKRSFRWCMWTLYKTTLNFNFLCNFYRHYLQLLHLIQDVIYSRFTKAWQSPRHFDKSGNVELSRIWPTLILLYYLSLYHHHGFLQGQLWRENSCYQAQWVWLTWTPRYPWMLGIVMVVHLCISFVCLLTITGFGIKVTVQCHQNTAFLSWRRGHASSGTR